MNRLESLAKAVWEYYYPLGGSVYKTYESTPEDSKKACMVDALKIARYLDGQATIEDVKKL